MESVTLRVIRQEAERAFCRHANVLISFEIGAPTAEYFEQVLTCLETVAREHPPGAGLLVVLRTDAPPPGEAARGFVMSHLDRFSAAVRAHAHVIEGEGFIAAAKRSVITLMFSARRNRFPVKIFRDVEEAIPWLYEQLGQSAAEAAPFIDAVRAFRDKQFGGNASRRG